MRLLPLFLLLLLSFISNAQEYCVSGFNVPIENTNDCDFQEPENCVFTEPAEEILIPIVFHICLPEPSDITKEQINSQISRINADFNKQFSNQPYTFHTDLVADAQIKFYLAYVEELCNGVSRNVYEKTVDISDDITSYDVKTISGHLPVDQDRILNIWVADISEGIYGHGVFPHLATQENDGIIIDLSVFGSGGSNNSQNYSLGGTLSHEIGHYLNLYHLFQGTDVNPCSNDFVCDTPQQNGETLNCPTGNPLVNVCANNQNETNIGVLYINFMDYSPDECRYSFTPGQVARMHHAINNCRSSLLLGPSNFDCCLNDAPELIQESALLLCEALDLNDFIVGSEIPIGSEVVWSNSTDFSDFDAHLETTLVSGLGDYYAFYFYPYGENCFSPYATFSVLGDLVVEGETIIMDVPKLVSGNIYVKSGGELTVSSVLEMSQTSTIFVEQGGRLIVDGGIITSCAESQWRGVRLEGILPKNPIYLGQVDDPFEPLSPGHAGVVIVHNDGTIDNAKDGISTFNYHLGSEEKKHRGGLIYCNSANFTNCERAVEIMKYGTPNIPDKSKFNDTRFLSCKEGVSNWSSDGVTFTQCEFDNIEKHGLLIYDAAVNVYDNNVFKKAQRGIDIVGTVTKQLSSVIGLEGMGPNIFEQDCYYGIDVSSYGNTAPLLVQNNIFQGNLGINIEGNSHYIVEMNDFQVSGHGIFAVDTDDNPNFIRNNDFVNTGIPITGVSNNQDLKFTNNCMDNSGEFDVWIYGSLEYPGRVDLNQGTQAVASGNNFSKQGTTELRTSGTTELFRYFVEENQGPGSVYYPDMNGNFDRQLADGQDSENCGTGNVQNPNPPQSEGCETPSTISALIQHTSHLDQELAGFQSNEKEAINSTERCLVKALQKLALTYADAENKNGAKSYFAQRPEFIQRTIPYALELADQEYIDARTYLNSMTAVNSLENNYKVSQNIYLDYLESEDYFLNVNDSLTLITNGQQYGPLSGYSRSIYFVITGKKIELPLLIQEEFRRSPEEEPIKPSELVSIYPNPNNDGNIWITGLDLTRNNDLVVFDISGRQAYRTTLNSTQVEFNNLSSGTYFLVLRENGLVIFREKLIIQ